MCKDVEAQKYANEFGRPQVIPSSSGNSSMQREPGDETGEGGTSKDLSQKSQ